MLNRCTETENTILQTRLLPISFIADKEDSGASINKLLNVCCALVNLCPSVAPQA